MKKLTLLIVAAVLAALVSCSAGTPQDQLKEIDELLNKGFPMTAEQSESVTSSIAGGKQLLEEGKSEESKEAFAKALKVLNLAQDAYIFNKAD